MLFLIFSEDFIFRGKETSQRSQARGNIHQKCCQSMTSIALDPGGGSEHSAWGEGWIEGWPSWQTQWEHSFDANSLHCPMAMQHPSSLFGRLTKCETSNWKFTPNILSKPFLTLRNCLFLTMIYPEACFLLLPCFVITSLLKYNSYTREFTDLTCNSEGFNIFSEVCHHGCNLL